MAWDVSERTLSLEAVLVMVVHDAGATMFAFSFLLEAKGKYIFVNGSTDDVIFLRTGEIDVWIRLAMAGVQAWAVLRRFLPGRSLFDSRDVHKPAFISSCPWA